MKKLMKKLEDMMVAVTFAEAGEYDEVRHRGTGGQEETTSSCAALGASPESAGE